MSETETRVKPCGACGAGLLAHARFCDWCGRPAEPGSQAVYLTPSHFTLVWPVLAIVGGVVVIAMLFAVLMGGGRARPFAGSWSDVSASGTAWEFDQGRLTIVDQAGLLCDARYNQSGRYGEALGSCRAGRLSGSLAMSADGDVIGASIQDGVAGTPCLVRRGSADAGASDHDLVRMCQTLAHQAQVVGKARFQR